MIVRTIKPSGVSGGACALASPVDGLCGQCRPAVADRCLGERPNHAGWKGVQDGGSTTWTVSTEDAKVTASGGGSYDCTSGAGTVTVSAAADAQPGPVTITVTGTTSKGLLCTSTAQATVQECVDLQFQGVSDQDEADPGGYLCLNDDDDNGDDSPDKDDVGPTAGEDDLASLIVSIKAGLTGTVRLEAAAGATKVKLYENPDRSAPVTLPVSWSVPAPQFPKTLYVEGIDTSAAVGDVELLATFTGNGGPCEDIAKLTVFTIDTLEWEAPTGLGNLALDNAENNGGRRIFPGQLSPTDANPLNRRKVDIVATLLHYYCYYPGQSPISEPVLLSPVWP